MLLTQARFARLPVVRCSSPTYLEEIVEQSSNLASLQA